MGSQKFRDHRSRPYLPKNLVNGCVSRKENPGETQKKGPQSSFYLHYYIQKNCNTKFNPIYSLLENLTGRIFFKQIGHQYLQKIGSVIFCILYKQMGAI